MAASPGLRRFIDPSADSALRPRGESAARAAAALRTATATLLALGLPLAAHWLLPRCVP